jgi:hypothetical protein
MRGRNNNNNNNSNNNNRRGPNPLTRSYESNGPDVKIRGSAQQIAEKYTTLARDAQTSGDRVMAENYLQHAEHYYRIIAAAQAQQAIQQARDTSDETDEDGEDDQQHGDGQRGENMAANGQREHRQHYANDGSGPQPVIEDTPAEVAYDHGSGGPNGVGNGHADGERTQPQASAGSVDNGHSQGEHVNGSQVEAAAAAEESAAPRRGRRPRRKATAAALEPEAAGAVEGPSGESGGAMEQAE